MVKKKQAVRANSVSTCVETITPGIAGKLLRHADGDANIRHLHAATVKRYANSMLRGWELNGSAIVVDKRGMVTDGQHRLHACVDANVPFTTVVVRGLDSSLYMNAGKSVTLPQILQKRGVRYTSAISTACRYLWVYEMTGSFALMRSAVTAPDIGETRGYYEDHAEELGGYALQTKGTIELGLPQSSVLALAALTGRTGPSLTDDWLAGLCTGERLEGGDPRMSLRRRAMRQKDSRQRMNPRVYMALIIKAWNAYCEGRNVSVLTFKIDLEPFPDPIIPTE